ncbi:lytic transglycosylase domain-containing protein [Actinomadura xylanilytica]|uniref:lytic transglycosylase domain-containing protein n=1 Tax=Actinomadura xylanilytica TaxID=887459 RepID=UPI00255AFA84|nr:lytic transglycosylase domain-containing protein [Actinomadura xylanilytica]MDL4775021.1 lytic transglycosylase domain-containing protein [Actinomadura xylanilytica]
MVVAPPSPPRAPGPGTPAPEPPSGPAAERTPPTPPSPPGREGAARAKKPKPEKKQRSRPPAAGAAPAPGRRRRRPSPLLIAGIAVLVLGNVTGGVYAALTTDDEPRGSTGPRADPPPAGGAAGPGGPVTNVADDGQVAPLRRVVPPDVLAVGAAPLDQRKIAKLGRLGRVRDVISVAGGAVQLQGRQVNAFAVDPSAFRSWTPPGTATKTELWTALAGGQFVVSSDAAEQLQLSRGLQYPIVGRTMPRLTLGGSSPLGLPGIDVLVGKKAGTDIGLVPNVAVMVNAPGVEPGKLAKAVGTVLGGGAKVVDLHEKKYQAPAGGGARSGSYLDLYKKAATTCPGLSWTVLAAIGQVESDHGRNAGRSSAGALGPMQFMPATWKSYGVDGDGDGKADIMNPYDAIPGAAKYLCANGAGGGGKHLYQAVWHYNHADWYVQKVLNLAQAYAARFS